MFEYFITYVCSEGVEIAHPKEGKHYLQVSNAVKYCEQGLLRGMIDNKLVPCLQFNGSYNPNYYCIKDELFSFRDGIYHECSPCLKSKVSNTKLYRVANCIVFAGENSYDIVVPYAIQKKYGVFDISSVVFRDTEYFHVQGIKQIKPGLQFVINQVFTFDSAASKVTQVFVTDDSKFSKMANDYTINFDKRDFLRNQQELYNSEIERVTQKLVLHCESSGLFLDDVQIV